MKASAVARPDTPPGAMSFGTVKIDRPKPTSAVPITVKSRSSTSSFTEMFFKNFSM